MTTPASDFSLRVRNATPGVVITPAERHFAPARFAPRVRARWIDSPDSRVSLPTMISGRWPFFARCEASEKPIALIVVASSGNCPASPRIPSVPKRDLMNHKLTRIARINGGYLKGTRWLSQGNKFGRLDGFESY